MEKSSKISFRFANKKDREKIYQARHQIYAEELGQHPINKEGKLSNDLDEFNYYIVAFHGEILAGFISVTPPQNGKNETIKYGIDKYIERSKYPFPVNMGLYEIRLTTIMPDFRGSFLLHPILYSAFRLVEELGGNRIMTIGRIDLVKMYQKAGLVPEGIVIRSGQVEFELMSATIDEINTSIQPTIRRLKTASRLINWDFDFPYIKKSTCYHGGSFFRAIGEDFSKLELSKEIINADVLDAWFDPAPEVIDSISSYLPWLLKTSPPTNGEGLIRTISKYRNIPRANLLIGGGSSDLIYLAFNYLLNKKSKALLLSPTYGEYSHILKSVIACEVDSIQLTEAEGFHVNIDSIIKRLSDASYSLAVIVNPNNPTGQILSREDLKRILDHMPEKTLLWIDEAYVNYLEGDYTMEPLINQYKNLIVCKSMSKSYALSGARAAYLSCSEEIVEKLKPLSPPWALGSIGQIAAVKALESESYYNAKYKETANLREELKKDLSSIEGMTPLSSAANFILIHLNPEGPTGTELIQGCSKRNLYIRNANEMGIPGQHTIRIAVKTEETNRKMVKVLKEVYCELQK